MGMAGITDEYMRQMLGTTRGYAVVVLSDGPNRGMEGAAGLVWEHGRRNFELRADGRLAIVCPVLDDSEVAGIGIFTTSAEETAHIMDGDPAVAAGVFV